jgi:pSer/pThr/pTyr-binding forkhead associated (FHA) protein
LVPYLRVTGVPAPEGVPLGRFDLHGERVVIGRSADADLCLPDARVSRIHLVLERDAAGWCASDRGSANGTLVNGRRLSGTTRLRPGLMLAIAGYQLRFEDETAAPDLATVEGLSKRVALSPQEQLAVTWLCEPARRGRGEFVGPASVREICDGMHLAKSTVEKLLNGAQRKLLGEQRPLDRGLLATLARSTGVVTDEDLDNLPPPTR